jgi:hypothetical protein
MYKLLANLPGLESNIVQRLSDNSCIPFDTINTDYSKFLDDINEFGTSIVDGEISESVLTHAASRKFNKQLNAYVGSVERLTHYILSEGRPEIKEMLPSGRKVLNQETMEYEDVLVETITQTAIEPLPETVEVYEGDEKVTVPNPAIVQDEEQRAAAQAIVDATPQEVKDAA